MEEFQNISQKMIDTVAVDYSELEEFNKKVAIPIIDEIDTQLSSNISGIKVSCSKNKNHFDNCDSFCSSFGKIFHLNSKNKQKYPLAFLGMLLLYGTLILNDSPCLKLLYLKSWIKRRKSMTNSLRCIKRFYTYTKT